MNADYSPQALRKLAERESVINARLAFKFAGLSEGVGYELARRGDLPFPILRLGDRIKVPTAGLLAALGLDEPANTATDWKAKYEEAVAHSRKWEARARANAEALRALIADDPAATDAA